MRRLIAMCLLLFVVETTAATPDFGVRVTPFDQVFPALELSQARRTQAMHASDHIIGEGSGLIAVSLRAHHPNERIVLTISAPGLVTPQRFSATLARTGVTYSLHPPLDWDATALRAIAAPRDVALRFELQRDGVDAGTQMVSVSLRPLNEALYFVRDDHDSVDLSWIFAAYVNENDPIVAQVLEEARASGIAPVFNAYASADPEHVYRQVWAIWDVLSRRGIRYSSANPAIERGPHSYSQRVRSLAQTWADRSANCIDGSVLIASVLQRIGVRSFLVLVPGHAFIGFYTDADAQHAAYLETTLLGARVRPHKIPGFATGIPAAGARNSLATFAAALAAGRAHHARVARKLDGRHRPDYAVIDIPAARAFGIKAISKR